MLIFAQRAAKYSTWSACNKCFGTVLAKLNRVFAVGQHKTEQLSVRPAAGNESPERWSAYPTGRCGKFYIIHYTISSPRNQSLSYFVLKNLSLICSLTEMHSNRDYTFEPEKLHFADFHIEGEYKLPESKETYDKYIEGGHGHTVVFFIKKALMLGWKAEEQRRFLHLRGKPTAEDTGEEQMRTME